MGIGTNYHPILIIWQIISRHICLVVSSADDDELIGVAFEEVNNNFMANACGRTTINKHGWANPPLACGHDLVLDRWNSHAPRTYTPTGQLQYHSQRHRDCRLWLPSGDNGSYDLNRCHLFVLMGAFRYSSSFIMNDDNINFCIEKYYLYLPNQQNF